MPSVRSSRSSAVASPPRTGSSTRTSVVLGLGAFGLAWSLTTTAAYLPPLLEKYTESTTLVGLVLAAEGAFAIFLPLVIGPWSDTFHTPLGRRRPFMLAAVGPMAFGLALLAFMPSLWTTALMLFGFFFAYYVYEPPYRGLYPDLLPDHVYGRAQSIQHIFRGVALGCALIGGGFLAAPLEPGAISRRGGRGLGRLPCADPLPARGRWPRARLRRCARVHQALVARAATESGCRPLPGRKHGLGGDVRRGEDVRRALHHGRRR